MMAKEAVYHDGNDNIWHVAIQSDELNDDMRSNYRQKWPHFSQSHKVNAWSYAAILINQFKFVKPVQLSC